MSHLEIRFFSVPFSDPSCYAPVIDYVKCMAEDMQGTNNDYVVLLLITDGGIAGKKLRFSQDECRN